MMTKDEILSKLRENKERLNGFGIKKIGIFGSYIKDKATEKSDVDVVVEFESGKATFRNVCGLVDFLEELFNREIDLLTPDGIDAIRIKHLKEEIKREIEYV